MKRFWIVVGLALALMAGWAQAQEKPKSEAERMKELKKEFDEFKPGSDTTYNWVTDVKEGLDKMKEDKCPGLIYFYCPDDKKTAFVFETKIFANPEFSTVGGKFITIKMNSTDEKALEKAQSLRMQFAQGCKGKTGVAFLAPTGKQLMPSMTMPNKAAFKRAVTAIEKKFAAKEAKEGEGEKKEGKEAKEGEKKEEKEGTKKEEKEGKEEKKEEGKEKKEKE